jgi:NAD(P)-dependent dehydrogenase (short-subunit alcohol dehydrogenase family)
MILFAYGHQSLQVIHYVILWIILSRMSIQPALRSTGRRTTPIVADVNNKQDLARVEAKLKDDPSITMLVNNAGCASVAPLLDADIEKMEDMIALNISLSPSSAGILADIPLGWLHTFDGTHARSAVAF